MTRIDDTANIAVIVNQPSGVTMTAKQQAYMQHLAEDNGYTSRQAWARAAADVLDMSSSKVQRKGLTARQASEVIDALIARQES